MGCGGSGVRRKGPQLLSTVTGPEGPEQTNDEARRRRTLLVLAAILVVSILPYLGTLSDELIADDLALLLDHPAIGNPLDLSSALGSSYWGQGDDLYRPLTLWSFSLNHAANRLLGLPGVHPASYHLVNLLVHLAVGLVFYAFLRRLGLVRWAAGSATLLFAAHPLHTEAVATIVGRSELLAAAFGLAFLLLHRSHRSVTLGAVALFLALASKESALTFLLLAIWLDISVPDGKKRGRFVAYGVYGAIVAAWLGLRAWAIDDNPLGTPFVDNPLVLAGFMERMLTALSVQFDYLRLHFLPIGLSSDYSFDQIPLVRTPFAPRLAGLLGVGAVAAAAAWTRRRSEPLFLFAVFGYVLLFSLTANVLFPIGTIMGERLAYSPSLAICLLLGLGAHGLRRRWGGRATVAVVAVTLVFVGMTVRRNLTWRDWPSYVEAQVRSAPSSAKAHYNMAVLRFERDDMEGAEESCLEAVSIHSGYAEAWDRLGRVFAEKADLARAIEAYLQATKLHPGFAAAWEHLADARLAAGEFESAARSYERAAELEPGLARLHHGLGLALQRLDELDEAARAYRRAIELRPDLAPSYSNLAAIHAARGELDQAERLWLEALAADPEYAVARSNLERLELRRRPQEPSPP
jgi:tetratricopeptide (TPR) repeat protein